MQAQQFYSFLLFKAIMNHDTILISLFLMWVTVGIIMNHLKDDCNQVIIVSFVCSLWKISLESNTYPGRYNCICNIILTTQMTDSILFTTYFFLSRLVNELYIHKWNILWLKKNGRYCYNMPLAHSRLGFIKEKG